MDSNTDTDRHLSRPQPSKVWVESIQTHLELLNQIAAKLPANERLEVADLNKIIDLDVAFRQRFLLMVSLYGFHIPTKGDVV